MFKLNDYVVYKTDVCIIKEKNKNKFTNLESYKLAPIEDDSLMISVPVENKNEYLRPLISLEEVKKLIEKIPDIEIIEPNTHTMENEYRKLLHTGKHEDLVKIIKTTYLRNKERTDNKRSVGEKDKEYFSKAERYLYNELSLVLNMSYDETKKYIIDMLSDQEL